MELPETFLRAARAGRTLLKSRAGRLAVASVVTYSVAAFAVVALHRRAIFPAPKSDLLPTLSGATVLRLECEGPDVLALYAPPDRARGVNSVVVFFHGNGQELVDLSTLARTLMDRGLGILFVEYPGYGAAKGSPSEVTVYAAAARALAELSLLGVAPEEIVLVGQSLGTGVAVEMATRGYGRRMILISPYTSMAQVVGRFAPFVPVDWIVKDRFDSLAKAPNVTIPTLIIHGKKDRLIPFEMGAKLREAMPKASLVAFEAAGHNDLFSQEQGRLVELLTGAVAESDRPATPLPSARKDTL